MSLIALHEKYTLTRGDAHNRSLPFKQQNEAGENVAIDLAAVCSEIAIDIRKGDRDSALTQRLSLTGGELTVQDTNVLVWNVDTSEMLGRYFYELQLTYQDGSRETWIKGELLIKNDVTL